jgi:hypothetical protein
MTAPLEDVGTILRRQRAGLISDEALAEETALGMRPDGYGGKGNRWAETVIWIAQRFDCGSVLDYGCGEGKLRAKLIQSAPRLDCREYDPRIPGKDQRQRVSFADLVVCTDVLEHVEPETIGNVIRDIDTLARKVVFLVVCLRPSNKVLSDGVTNAHRLVRSKAWWEAKLAEHHMEIADLPDLPIPPKVDREKHWIVVVRPS